MPGQTLALLVTSDARYQAAQEPPVRSSSMTTSESLLLTVHLAATAAMMGLIWFVQVVHYPLFDRVGADHFTTYEAMHQRATSFVVGPLMAVEGVSALIIAATARDILGLTLPLVGLVLLAIIHASTVFLQVPAHAKLSKGHHPAVVRHLVRTNWIRTTGWTLRSIVAVVMSVYA
jgi:hypothetical protein